MCNFQNRYYFITIINDNYKNVFKLLLSLQHISLYSNFTINYREKMVNISNALKKLMHHLYSSIISQKYKIIQ